MVHPSPISRAVRFILPGYHAVREALVSGRPRLREIWVREGREDARVMEIRQMAERGGVPLLVGRAADLEALAPGLTHQGIAGVGDEFHYASLEGIMDHSFGVAGGGLVVAADHITDEGNLGALVRASVFFGVHGLVLPRDRSAAISSRVLKGSSGALLHLPVARVVNLGRALDLLSRKGFWIIGAAGESGESLYDFDWRRDLVLVLGSEQKGLSPSIRARCHEVVAIPGSGRVGSLNVSVAAGVILSEIARSRALGG